MHTYYFRLFSQKSAYLMFLWILGMISVLLYPLVATGGGMKMVIVPLLGLVAGVWILRRIKGAGSGWRASVDTEWRVSAAGLELHWITQPFVTQRDLVLAWDEIAAVYELRARWYEHRLKRSFDGFELILCTGEELRFVIPLSFYEEQLLLLEAIRAMSGSFGRLQDHLSLVTGSEIEAARQENARLDSEGAERV